MTGGHYTIGGRHAAAARTMAKSPRVKTARTAGSSYHPDTDCRVRPSVLPAATAAGAEPASVSRRSHSTPGDTAANRMTGQNRRNWLFGAVADAV